MKTDDTKDFKDAVNNFKRVLEINESPLGTQKVDTTVIYNAGVAAHKAGDLDEAIKFYKKSLELNYEAGKIYAMVAKTMKHWNICTKDTNNIPIMRIC